MTPGSAGLVGGRTRDTAVPLPQKGLPMLRCVLFIPSGPSAIRWRDICAKYANDQRYLIVAVTSTWAAALAMLTSGEAEVAVIGRRDHLPPDRIPRVEVATEPHPVRIPSPMSRRTVRRRPAKG